VDETSVKVFPTNTVLMAMYGDGKTITSLGILRAPATSNQACCAMIVNQRRCDHRYLYYTLKALRDDFIQIATGGAQRNLSARLIRNFAIPLPPLDEQHRIAAILGALDDKIELNRRTNETLGATARAIFEENIVEAARSLRPPSWRTAALDEIAKFLNGLAMQKYPTVAGRAAIPVIKIAQLRTGQVEDADLASADLDSEYVVQDGDILFSWSGSLECVLWTGGRGALNQHLFKVTSTEYPKWFVYLWIHEHLDDFRHIAAGKATTMGHIQRHHLSDAKVSIPDETTMQNIDRAIAPMLAQMIRLRLQSRTLATLRDTILPKFLSGELTPRPVEHQTEKAL
jgi:type I restriction enzyme, S subunit